MKPIYFGRHDGQDFLIVCTGPSLSQHLEKVRSIVRQPNLVSIGCNRIPSEIIPSYHFFVNRKRFGNYGHLIHQTSKVLLSADFSDDQIHEVIGKRAYETVQFENTYPGERGRLQVLPDQILAESATVGPIACAVALQMGAKNIFIAGMDGYQINQPTHHYAEADDKEMKELLSFNQTHQEIVAELSRLLEERGGKLDFVTPSVYTTPRT